MGIPMELFRTEKVNQSNADTMTKDLINFLLEQYELFRNQTKKEVIQQAEKWLMLRDY